MHGLGNDFVIISERDLPKEITDYNVFAAQISNRRLGIGSDQFIIYQTQTDQIVMTIYNQDGSKAKACGNASRCLSRLIFEQSGKTNIVLNVDGRKIICDYEQGQIKINMGLVSFEENWMPNKDQLWALAQRYLIEPKEMICADIGNPHLVIFSKLSKQDQKIIGKNFQNIDLFPQGINVNFARVEDNGIYLKVWERGVGFTYACGSGAIATFAAANILGFAGDSSRIVFELGALQMKKTQDGIVMSGPANYLFHGEYIYE